MKYKAFVKKKLRKTRCDWKLRRISREEKMQTSKVAAELFFAFDWKKTEEGFEYWNSVYNKLIRIASSPKGKARC